MNTNKFTFGTHELRTVEIDGAPWFVAADVCRCLELSVKNGGASRYLKNLDSDERRVVNRTSSCLPQSFRGSGFASREPTLTLITESGYNKLILRANPSRPAVHEFQNWIAREVLPAIRRTGGYLLNEEAREVAHADNRQEMPLPKEFLDIFKAQTALLEKIAASLEGWGGTRATEGYPERQDSFDKDFYKAREVVAKLKLAGALPTVTESRSMTVKVGQALSAICKQRGLTFKELVEGQYAVRYYPKAAVQEYHSGGLRH